MLKEKGAEALRAYGRANFGEARFFQVAPGVWYAEGLGHTNATAIEGKEGVVLVDCLDTVERARKLRRCIEETIKKPVHTIIYTHSHPDHCSGAAAFQDTVQEVIAMQGKQTPPPGMQRIGSVLNKRGLYQFGFPLDDDAAIHQGLGPRQGVVYGEHEEKLQPTTLYNQGEVVERSIDGINLRLISAPGETPDTMMVEIVEEGIVCCGDNYYGTWPNLYALRGTPYREVADWISSLDTLLACEAKILLPGHTKAIIGKEEVYQTIATYREAIQYVYDKTLEALAKDLSIEEAVAYVVLPPHLKDLPHLQEHYGTVAWSVRSIYVGYVGWFDGKASSLNPLSDKVRAEEMCSLLGGEEAFFQKAKGAYDAGKYPWALELVELLRTLSDNETYRDLYVKVLHALAEKETSANGRHYYLTLALEIEAPEAFEAWSVDKGSLFETSK